MFTPSNRIALDSGWHDRPHHLALQDPLMPITVDGDLVKAKELLEEARRLLVEEKAEECLGLLDGTLARVDRVISQLAQRDQSK